MFEVRIHGRGGQGVVTAADLLALAAFEEGRYAQSFPTFGSERTGAPVVAYCRLDERQIRTREPVVAPHALLVIDPTLVHQVHLFSGLVPDGFLLINTTRTYDQLGLASLLGRYRPDRLLTAPCSESAQRHTGRPLPNAALLGGFAAMTSEVSLDAVSAAIGARFADSPAVAAGNIAAAAEVYAHVRAKMAGGQERVMLGAPAD